MGIRLVMTDVDSAARGRIQLKANCIPFVPMNGMDFFYFGFLLQGVM